MPAMGEGTNGSEVRLVPGNSPPAAWIVGLGEPFAPDKLERLYPGGRQDYLRRFEAALAKAIAADFILPEDRQEILDIAAASYRGAP
jgi:hypothetical protein